MDEASILKAERRAKRQERRLQQREANPGRALKMRSARIADTGQSPLPDPPAVNIGCSGWFYWHWRKSFYPEELPTKEWFGYFSRHFKTVELNAPFYSWPTLANVATWRRQAGRRKFIYTVKVCELITHVKKFTGTKTLVKDFNYIARLLGPRMGCFLYQLPPGFHFTPARLRAITSQLDPQFRNVVEFRHRSWWNDQVYDAFRAAGIIFCSCSGPRLPSDLIVTSDDIYIRFHGTRQWYRHDYSDEELHEWADKIKSSGAKTVWIYFNNDRDGYAVKNAKKMSRILKRS